MAVSLPLVGELAAIALQCLTLQLLKTENRFREIPNIYDPKDERLRELFGTQSTWQIKLLTDVSGRTKALAELLEALK